MKYECDLIQDLLPLYEEGLCSPASRQAVQAHLRECEVCKTLTAPLPIEMPPESPAADLAVKKSMKKVRRRWLASLVAALMIVPLILMSVNQYQGQGLCFTNLDDVFTAWRFLHALETENWEKAAKMYDFSDDYDSILDALDMDVSDWGTTFTPFELAGHDYMASGWLSRYELVPETIGDLYGFLYNRTGTAMVPLKLWEQLMAMDPDAFDQNGWEYWLNGERYGKITTPWGDFVVSEGRGYDTAHDYASYFDLIPAAIYQEALPDLEAEALQIYTSTHNHVGWVAGLTEGEFTQEMTRRYTTDMKSLEGIVSFDCTGFRSAYRMSEESGSWCVIFPVTVTQGDQQLDAELQIEVDDGKVFVVSISHEPGAHWLDDIDRALYPSAHPEY